jgi:transposase
VEKGQPIMTLQGRRADEVVAWFRSRPPKALRSVDVVVVERSKACFTALKEVLGDQVHVIDRLHVVQHAVEARDAVWGSVKQQRDKDEANALKKLRKRWLKSADQVEVDALIARDEWRRRVPEWRETLDWVQNLRTWFERT